MYTAIIIITVFQPSMVSKKDFSAEAFPTIQYKNNCRRCKVRSII